MRHILYIILALCVGAAVGLIIGRRQSRAPSVIVSETVRVDTLRDTVPVPVEVAVISHERRRLPVATQSDSDTAAPPDSADVIVPVTQAVYTDSLYTAWISGYEPHLDSIAIFAPVRTVTIQTPPPRPPRWSVGIAAGYGYSPGRGFAPWIGIALTYSIKSF